MSVPASPPRTPIRSRSRPTGRATRARLVRAALELFTEQGFRATTTPELARRAGVAEATIYRHFSGKDALLNAAALEAVTWGLTLVSTDDNDHRLDAEVALGLIGRELAREAVRDPAMVRMLLRPPEETLHEDGTRQAIREFRGGLHRIMAAGKQRGRIRPGSAELWAAVWLALAGFVAERVAAGEWGVDHPNVELALEAAWQAVAYRIPDTPLEVVT
ncbi:MAG TPA: TetR/AcrR family transcriptional regulator [Gemmatimonadales bacterium]|jgi:AcrR family transcriptional regulator|nr:TetR/AcrR family transcriptional regulator [Gemmatimonadales bacterium]